MAYLLMIFEPRGQRHSREPAQAEQLYQQMLAFAADLNSRGLLRAESRRLARPVSAASRDAACHARAAQNARARALLLAKAAGCG